ncbi:MAG: hypothetical protein R3A48_19610 [Polyangiales bacterium]
MLPHDTLAKDVLEVLLDELGTFVRECEVPASASQRADAYFAPHPDAQVALRELGLLGRMCLRPCLLDPFHDPPSPDDVSESLRKFLNHRHGARVAPAERLWLPCAGRPDEALRRFGFERAPGWPAGFYALSEALPVMVVVLPELDDSLDTVALRLMGRREHLNRALRTLRGRTAAIPQGRRLFTAVVRWIMTWRGRGLRWEEDAMLDLTEAEFSRTAKVRRRPSTGVQQACRRTAACSRCSGGKLRCSLHFDDARAPLDASFGVRDFAEPSRLDADAQMTPRLCSSRRRARGPSLARL